MTEDNSMPNFWWCPTHHLYRGGETRPCASAVQLAPAPPAPRVFFPGETVPADMPVACLVNTTEGRLVGMLEANGVDSELSTHLGPVIELHGVPSPEEWQAVVDRARDARADAMWAHTEGTNP